MKKKAAQHTKGSLRKAAAAEVMDTSFAEILLLIEAARQKVFQAVNSRLIELYWQSGGFISRKLASAEWGGTVSLTSW